MDERSDEVADLVGQFMAQYEEEVGRTALKASVLQLLKAEKTEPREEVQEIEIGTGQGEENNLELVQTDVSQIIRVYLLVDYGFQSSMMDSKRPYMSVLRLTMDCVNGTTTDEFEMDRFFSKMSIWNVAVEHFKLFRHGLTLGSQLTKDAAKHFEAQLDFVQSSMACDVTSTSGNGTDAIMKSWGYSQWFENVDVQVESMEKNAENLLVAFTRTEVTITAQTLRVLFPHLCSVERENDEFQFGE